ncbi:hypothetical protein DSO57_1021252 [Entomophthora muscae]|uniref:Uncharacterized protein n=1 Tax=Entomophthora muscae TaxID=34485 RepID=A0ACC2UNV5_9FUNG|nr:hypothetical protein DSO57_1021252 [Entomophthora muscae]
MNLYQGIMAAKDYIEEFSHLKEAICMTDSEACYLFQKKLAPELKNFLSHHVLSYVTKVTASRPRAGIEPAPSHQAGLAGRGDLPSPGFLLF